MALSNNLISQFVKATSDNNKSTKNEGTAYGTTVINNGITYVRLDGSEQLTPVSTTANIKPDERVMVKIKNHSATIVGNLTSPAARIGDVNDLQNDVNVKFDTTNGAIEAEVSRSTEAEGELASKLAITEEAISTEVTNRQNADNEMSTRISQTAHSISISASGGEKSVGLTVQLFDENGNLIDTESDTANIIITGMVTFADLAGEGTTTINGSNITTGIISAEHILLIDANGDSQHGNAIRVCTVNNLSDVEDRLIRYIDDNYNTLKLNIQTHGHTITPTKNTPSSGSGTHNFMYNLEQSSGTDGFSYTYGYVSGSLSDERLKENIRPIEDISDKYMRLEPIQFNFHNDIRCVFKGTHYGFGARAVSEIFNDDSLALICKEHQEDEAINRYLCGDDAYVLDKDELHALHVQMIQKHQKEIWSLKQKNLDLYSKLAQLEQRMEELENVISKQNN